MEDKRKSPRKASLTRCVVDRIFAHKASIPSRVINYSDHGMMLELDYQLFPGEAVAVKFSSDAVEVAAYGCTTCIGMIRWCDRQEGRFGAFYGAGVELANRSQKRVTP